MTTQFLDKFQNALKPVAGFVQGKALNKSLASDLNLQFPADGEVFLALAAACREGVEIGELCQRDAGGIKYGRVFGPSDELAGCSVDVVYMRDVVGPHHSHPRGEIDMVVPVSATARFDGSGAGWVVYGPGSAHRPTVEGGDAIVLYLLPGGEINFSRE